jgi:PAS domain S-box-containing protein
MFLFNKLWPGVPKILTSNIVHLVIILVLFPFYPAAYADRSFENQHVLKSASELDSPPFAIVQPDGTAVLQQIFSILVPLLLFLTLLGIWYLNRLVVKRTKYLEREIQQRKSIEEELAQANRKSIKAQELGRVGNWEFNIVTRKISGSREAKKIFGFHVDSSAFTVEEVNNCILEEERVHQALANLVQKNVPYNLEFDIVTRDRGEKRTIMSLAEVDRDEAGNPKKILGVIQDITERRQTENSLRESEEMHSALVEGLPDIVMRFDRDGRHLFVSENVCEMVEMQADQFIGKTHRELGFSLERCIFWEKSIKKVFDEGFPLETEYSFEAKDGQIINNRLIPERDDKGFVKSVLSLNRDITAHRKAENNYRTIFREMLEGFALHDIVCDAAGVPVDYRFLAVNPSFERMTGLIAENIVGRSVLEILPGTEDHWIETYGKVALTGEPVHFENYSSELQKHFEITAFRPAPNQFACLLNDITERKKTEAEKENLRSQLVQAQKMEAIGTLAGGIAHNFNNILGVMLGYSEMVRENCAQGSLAASDMDQVLAAGNRAKDLVKQILAFSRQTETKKISIQPAILVKETIKLLRASIPTTITIKQNIDTSCDLILADPAQIHQILMNLCANAFHAMEENGGTLSISLKKKIFTGKDLVTEPLIRPGNFVQLSVGDTGTGINPEFLGKIFDPYFTTKETGKGTGMGLAITHGIVQSYGGFITCESRINEGSIFYINLPSSEEHSLPETKVAESISAGTEHILMVEDEPMLAELGRTMLERIGYTVTIQRSSLEALATFENQPDAFDLVITDQTMPGMTGIDMAQRMLLLRPGLPIILCTGYSSPLLQEKVTSLGIKGFALKPMTIKGITALIRKVLEK